MEPSFGQIERLVLGRYKLVSSKQSIGGRMIANFQAPVGTEDKVEIEIEFDEPRGMLPLRVPCRHN